MGPIDPNITIEILFRSGIHQKRGPLYLADSLHLNPTKRGPKAKSIPKKWAEKQPNDHTNPSIPDDSTADTQLDKLLIPLEEAEEHFKGRQINEIL
ncbi:hypothetical protein EPUS_09462 [Endocarpon pusillum Z07020]|uniref:Uncharacterized protein n=1 Tax=Endocarpon pusillum (strain Z07020 / HMAS-L-300199) TaxID=1263415 RepID=U1GBI9_ENDPU|nr:uncharacterized protein EPUS_09462 [Endocarpon pusillum Z07020]ERF69056.1 hypothetical protein EPUS_09462 [Endocarpon pusillum Z07020]